MLPFIQTPAITHCHYFSFGPDSDVRRRVHGLPFLLAFDVHIVCSVFWDKTGFLHSKCGLPTSSFVSLCQVVSQHSCQVNAAAPGTLFVLPKRLPTSFGQACRLEDKASERMGFESANNSFIPPQSFYRFSLYHLNWVFTGTLALSFSFFLEPLYKLRQLAD